MVAIQPNDAVDPLVPEIIRSTITGRREHGPPDSDLIDLPFPLIDRWKAATSFHSDPQLLKPPEYSGIPNREQTRVLLLSKLNETKLTDKSVSLLLSVFFVIPLCCTSFDYLSLCYLFSL